jgi:hypothetical protein
MDKKDVRIGNWVHAFKTTWQIDETDFVGDKISTYQPIPLTYELLKKSGAEDVVNSGDPNELVRICGFTADLDSRKRKNSNGSWWVEIGGDCDSDRNEWVEVEYLHTLQNLIYALNKEELEINL